jgi:hypothetical protein
MATMADEISLRPLSLRPGAGVNPFASFALGAGIGLKNKVHFQSKLSSFVWSNL